jgi:hypothetical protein
MERKHPENWEREIDRSDQTDEIFPPTKWINKEGLLFVRNWRLGEMRRQTSLIRLSGRTSKPRRTLSRFSLLLCCSHWMYSKKGGGVGLGGGLISNRVIFISRVAYYSLASPRHLKFSPFGHMQPRGLLACWWWALSLIESKAFGAELSWTGVTLESPLPSDLFRYFICVCSLSPLPPPRPHPAC